MKFFYVWVSALVLLGCTTTIRMPGPESRQLKDESKENIVVLDTFHIPADNHIAQFRFSLQNRQLRTRLVSYRQRRSLNARGWILNTALTAGIYATGVQFKKRGYVTLGNYFRLAAAIPIPLSFLFAQKKLSAHSEHKMERSILGVEPLAFDTVTIKSNICPEKVHKAGTDAEGLLRLDILKQLNCAEALKQAWRKPILYFYSKSGHDLINEVALKRDTLNSVVKRVLGPPVQTRIPPRSSPELLLAPSRESNILIAGDKVNITIQVHNQGKGPYSRLVGTIESQNGWLNDHTFYLGHIKPGEKKEQSLQLTVPRFHRQGFVHYLIRFNEYNNFEPEPLTGKFMVQEIPKPRFQVAATEIIDGQSDHTVGNSNNFLEVGERVCIVFEIKNTGREDAKNVKVEYKTDEHEGLLLDANTKPKYIHLLKKEGGTHRYLAFMTLTNKFVNDSVHVKLNISEQKFGANQIFSQGFAVGKRLQNKISEEEVPADSSSFPESASAYNPDSLPPGAGNMPPAITFSYKNRQIVDTLDCKKASLTLKISVWDEDDLDTVRIKMGSDSEVLDKTVILPNSMRHSSGQIYFNYDKTFEFSRSGLFKVSVDAKDKFRFSHPETIYIRKQDALPANVWVVCMGISTYTDGGIPSLKYAHKDAKALARYFKNTFGLPEERVVVLTDQNATRTNIKTELGIKLARKVGPEDLVIISFSGHGDEEQIEIGGESERNKYILPVDAHSKSLYSTAIQVDELQEMFRRLNAKHIVFIGDYNYRRGRLGRESAKELPDFRNPFKKEYGRFILTSSRPDEQSKESDSLKHGAYTWSLLEGLKGKADANNDGKITILEIHDYSYDKVVHLTNNGQHPRLTSRGGDLVIGLMKRRGE